MVQVAPPGLAVTRYVSGEALLVAGAVIDTVALTAPLFAVGVEGAAGAVTVGAAVATEPTCAAVSAVLLQILRS